MAASSSISTDSEMSPERLAAAISESVMIGSVYAALRKKWFSSEAVLEWLRDAPISNSTRIAYSLVCHQIEPDNQYLKDENQTHLLSHRPEYAALAQIMGQYLNTGFNLEKASARNYAEETRVSLDVLVIEKLTEEMCDPVASAWNHLIATGEGPQEYVREHLVDCYRARNFPHLSNMEGQGHYYNTALVQADWKQRFRYNDQLAGLVLERVQILKQTAPMYFEAIGKPLYRKVMEKLHREHLLVRLTVEEMGILNSLFPGIIDPSILQQSGLVYRLSTYSPEVASYLLGFPIQSMVANAAQLQFAINHLIAVGPAEYATHISKMVKSTYLPIAPFGSAEITFPNATDVLLEPIDSYAPFDIVAFQDGTHVYRFTRPELETLVADRKNPWTKEELPPAVISTLQARAEAATRAKLPPCRPLLEMLERIEAGTVYEEEPAPPPTSVAAQTEPEVPPMGGMQILMPGGAFMQLLHPGQNEPGMNEMANAFMQVMHYLHQGQNED